MILASPARFFILLLIAAVRLWLGPHVVDDAYITFRYAENLSSGSGFAFNPGERVLGTSSPLLALLLVPGAATGLDLGWVTLVLSTAADCVTALVVSRWLTESGWPLASVVFGAAIALWPGFVTYSVSGLETSLFIALHVLVIQFIGSRPVTVGLLCGAAVLCRPDGAWIAALALAGQWASHSRVALRTAAGMIAVMLPWALFAVSYFGTIVPASVSAKAQHRASVFESLSALGDWFWRGEYQILSLVAVLGLWGLLRGATATRFRFWSVWWLGYAAAYVLTGAFGPYRWYFVPLLPLYAAAVLAGGEMVLRLAVARWPSNDRVAWAAVAIVAVFGMARLPALQSTIESAAAGREQLYRSAAADVLQPQTCLLAATEIGALGYSYKGPVLDLVGLVSPEVLGRAATDVIDERQPCWLATYSDHSPAGLHGSRTMREKYELAWSRRVSDTRDFLVYRRVGGR